MHSSGVQHQKSRCASSRKQKSRVSATQEVCLSSSSKSFVVDKKVLGILLFFFLAFQVFSSLHTSTMAKRRARNIPRTQNSHPGRSWILCDSPWKPWLQAISRVRGTGQVISLCWRTHRTSVVPVRVDRSCSGVQATHQGHTDGSGTTNTLSAVS